MIALPIIFLIVGILLGLFLKDPLRGDLALYVAVACLAGLDTICGAVRSNLEGRFDSGLMMSGFFANIVIAFAMSWLGDQIGANIFLVCAFIFGQRIFINLSVIRRLLLTKWRDSQERARQRAQEQQAQA